MGQVAGREREGFLVVGKRGSRRWSGSPRSIRGRASRVGGLLHLAHLPHLCGLASIPGAVIQLRPMSSRGSAGGRDLGGRQQVPARPPN